MRAQTVRIHAHGGPDVLTFEELEVGPPGAGEALVRQEACGVNYIDTYHRTNLYPTALPSGLGIEAAGVVEAVGEGVSRVQVGDRVAYASGPPGAYASLRNVRAEKLVVLPAGVDCATAAAVLLKGLTAHYLLHRTYRVQAGDKVLIHAAAGGVGSLLCQWAHALGAEVIGTVGSHEKAELVRGLGCAHPIVYSEEPWVERVLEITHGQGVPVVYDSVGQATFEGSLSCLRRLGMMVSYGQSSGAVPPLSVGVLAQKGSIFLTRPTLFDYVTTAEELDEAAAQLFRALADKVFSVHIHARYPLQDARRAHEDLEGRRTRGSLLLV